MIESILLIRRFTVVQASGASDDGAGMPLEYELQAGEGGTGLQFEYENSSARYCLIGPSFTVVQASDAGAGVLRAFENSSARYCVIGDRWTPGEHALLVDRQQFIGDMVDVGIADPNLRDLWQALLETSPDLLSTFIAGGVLKELPEFSLEAPVRVDLGAPTQQHVNDYLRRYLMSWPRRYDLRARLVDVAQPDAWPRDRSAIAVENAQVVGVLDQPLTEADLVISRRVPPPATPLPEAAGNASNTFVAHPRISVTEPARRGKTLLFTVGLSDRPDPDADEQRRIKINNPGTDETILVIASANGATVDEPPYAELSLDLAAEHEFTARVSHDAQDVYLRASYLFRNKPVGHIVKSVALEAGAPVVPPDQAPPSTVRATVLDRPRALTRDDKILDIDIVLYVQKAVPGFVSWGAYVAATGQFQGPYLLELSDSQAFARGLAGLRSRYGDSGKSAVEELRGLGQQIADCIPGEIVNEVLEPALDCVQPPTVLIMTDEAFTPWELARFSRSVVHRQEAAFLGEVARIGRWWTGRSLAGPRSSCAIRHVSAVAATEYVLNLTVQNLAHAKAERDWLAKTYGALSVEARLPEIDEWLDMKPRRPGHLGHIALHGFSDASPDTQGLILGDGKVLTPNRLAGEYYEDDCDVPRFEMVFLNACQAGTAGERLGRIAGFPGAVLGGGAAAFIGPLWEVEDKVAQSVAEQFYKLVLGEHEEVGEALRRLRATAALRDSITPWAYLYYGHPCLQLTLSQ